MLKLIIVTIREWNTNQALEFSRLHSSRYVTKIITNPKDVEINNLKRINPDFIFFIHWSWKIESDIISIFNPIMFHMTNLPYGRGGSPLQNLIIRGHSSTYITALFVSEKMDSGEILIKHKLELRGRAQDIFESFSSVVFKLMIPKIVNEFSKIKPIQQEEAAAVYFKRLSPAESLISDWSVSKNRLYDKLRMHDAVEYPLAFIRQGDYTIYFHNVAMDKSGKLVGSFIIKDSVDE